MHGAGNDFVVVDATAASLDGAGMAALGRRVCDRHMGVGADGLMFAVRGDQAPFRMRLWNSDGSEAEMCGNGIRCFARFLQKQGLASGDEFAIETGAGVKTVQFIESGERSAQIRVDMGAPLLRRADIPMTGAEDGSRFVTETLSVGGRELDVTCVSMGVPHCVVRVDDVDAFPVTEIGPLIENHPLFPRRTNVPFVQVLSDSELKARVWERGAGLTLACGTGACSCVVAGALNGWAGRSALVHLEGGDLRIEWLSDGRVLMTGPAAEVFTGEFPL